jgi:hypothetical protein
VQHDFTPCNQGLWVSLNSYNMSPRHPLPAMHQYLVMCTLSQCQPFFMLDEFHPSQFQPLFMLDENNHCQPFFMLDENTQCQPFFMLDELHLSQCQPFFMLDENTQCQLFFMMDEFHMSQCQPFSCWMRTHTTNHFHAR